MNFDPSEIPKIKNDILYEIAKPGAIIRVYETATKTYQVGTVTELFNNERSDLVILGLGSNSVSTLFNISQLKRIPIYKTRHTLQLVHEDELIYFLEVIEPLIDAEPNEKLKVRFGDLVVVIKAKIDNIKKVKNLAMKVGFKRYPKNKIQIFNMFAIGDLANINRNHGSIDLYSLIGIPNPRSNSRRMNLPSNHMR